MAEPPTVRLLCSFGGKILPRPSDGALRYAGGQTRVLSLRRSTTFPDFLLKLSQIAVNSPFSAVKYQLPDEDLDNLISISSQEDLDNMLDEFDRISEVQDSGSLRFRIFLLAGSDLAVAIPNEIAVVDKGQAYVDAVNGIGIRRNSSLQSAASSNEGINSPCISSPTAAAAHQDSGRLLGFYGDETLVSGSFLNSPSVNFPNFQNVNIQPIYVNNLKPNQKVEESSGNGKGFNQPLRELPPLHPALVHNLPSSCVLPLRPNPQQHVLRFEDCQMCQKALPHAHSDMLINEQFSGNGNGNGSGSSGVYEHRPVLQSYPTEDPMRLQALLRVENVGEARGESIEILDHSKVLHQPVTGVPVRMQAPLMAVDVEGKLKAETVANGVYRFSQEEKLVNPSIETFGQGKVLHPNRVVSGGLGESMVEQKVDNMAASAQFGGYGFAQIPRPRDNERIQVNPNVSTVTGFPSDVHASYGTLTHPSQWRPSYSFQSMTQNMVPPGYLVRQDMGIKQFVSYVSSVKNGNFHVAEPTGRVSVPEFSYDYSRPIEVMKEGVHVSTFEPSGIIDHHRPPPTVNHGVPMLKPETSVTSTLIAENSHASSGITEHHRPAPTVNLGVPLLKPESSTLIGENSHATSGITEHQRTSPTGNLGVPMLRPESAPLIPENNHAPLGSTEHHRPVPTVNLGVPMLKPENSTLTVENSHTASVITDHHRPALAVNLGVPMLRPESAPLLENSHTIRPQVGGNAIFLGNGVIKSVIAPEANYSRQINQLPPSTADLKPEHASVALDNSQTFRVQVGQIGRNPVYLGNGYIASGYFPEGNLVRPINQLLSPPSVMMANHGQLFPYSQEMRVQSDIPNERWLVMPPYSCGINPVYSNNAVSMHNNVPASPRSNAPPIQYANASCSNGNVEQFQGTTPPEPLFSNQDSQKIMANMQMMPSVPNKVSSKELVAPASTKEFVTPKDLSLEKQLINNKGSDVTMILKEGGLQNLENSSNKDACTEPVRFIQGGENNMHEVQALAEPIVTSVLQPSVPPATVSLTHERKETDHPSIKGSGLGESKVLSQAVVAAVGDHTYEGSMTKQADEMNFGFPVTDDIGCLQIIKNSDLEELRELGSGTFGTVYHAKWRGSDVAIKRINDRCFAAKPAEEERMRADFWNEACMLADLHHPNVVAFYGVVLDGPGGSFATVTEFMVNGSLRRALQKNDRTLDKRKRLLIAMDVAFGMEYLHGKNLIHFDLKSNNLLVNMRDPQRPICKVADLGLSKVKCQTLISGGVRGTLPWVAPELLNGGSNLVSEKVDVFSFGIVMWELLTGEEPYADLHYGAIIGGIVSNTLRPPVLESCDYEWKSLMEQCWSAEASQRPNFTEIASRLRLMAASLPQNG